MSMKISIIVPVYNEEAYIAKCLDSITKQKEKADEVIVVDNNCTDNTVKIAKEYPVKIIRERKQGMIYARNRGFDEANGDIIARCDADVILPEDWVARIKKHDWKSVAALVGPARFYDLPIAGTFYSKAYIFFMQKVQQHHTLIGSNMVITKNIWNTVRKEVCLDDSKVHEDIDLAAHIFNHDGEIVYDPELIVNVSARRIKNNPESFFLEYPKRLYNTLQSHK